MKLVAEDGAREDISEAIRMPDIAQGASTVSAHGDVRSVLLELQRLAGRGGGVVLEGRDIGTVVFPEAEVKFFLTASAEVRARRRHAELVAKGQTVSFEETLADVKQRDAQDEGRAVAPLKKADGAILVDSTDLSFEQTVAQMLEHVKRVPLGERAFLAPRPRVTVLVLACVRGARDLVRPRRRRARVARRELGPQWQDAFDGTPEIYAVVRPQAIKRDAIYGAFFKNVLRIAQAKTPMRGVTTLEALEGCEEIIVGIRKDASGEDSAMVFRGVPASLDPQRMTDASGHPVLRLVDARAKVPEYEWVDRQSTGPGSLFVLPDRTWVGAIGEARARARQAFASPFGRPRPEDRCRGARHRAPRRCDVPPGPAVREEPDDRPAHAQAARRHARAEAGQGRRRRDAPVRGRGRERLGGDARQAHLRRYRAPGAEARRTVARLAEDGAGRPRGQRRHGEARDPGTAPRGSPNASGNDLAL